MPVKSLLLGLALSTAALAASLSHATESTEIGWDDLLPKAEPYDDPFITMSEAQIEAMRAVVAFAEAETEDPELARADASARQFLAADGYDPDDLLVQYEVVLARLIEEATAVNGEIVGKTVRMPGYVLPLEMKGRKAVEFLLVPYVGACIHTPPPSPNQVVHVVYPDGFEAEGLFAPVWISGPLEAATADLSVDYSDGQADVRVSYRVNARQVEAY